MKTYELIVHEANSLKIRVQANNCREARRLVDEGEYEDGSTTCTGCEREVLECKEVKV